jgi:hypothetical protein
VRKIGNEMTKHPKSVYAGFALALVLAIGIHSPAIADATAESQELALQLVQRAELKKLAILSMRAHLWDRVDGEPVDPGRSTVKDQYFSQYECLRHKDGSSFEVPLAKVLAAGLTPEDMRGLLEFYSSPAADETTKLIFWKQHESLRLPKTGEYASLFSPPRISATQQDAITRVMSSESFIKMMRPLTQTNEDYFSAMGELVRQCNEVFVPTALNTSSRPSYPAIGTGGTPDPALINQVVVPATVKTSTSPAYPPIARRAGIQGAMVIEVYVDASGEPKQAWVSRQWFNSRVMPGRSDKTSTAEVFNEIGLAFAMNSTYAPATRNGVAVESVLSIPLRFRFEK